MTSPINNITRSAISSKQSLNILCFIHSDWFNFALCNALPQHKFYAPINDNNKPILWNFNLYPQPDNLFFIANFPSSNIISKVNFDLIICNDRASQYNMSKQISNILHINIIILEHLASVKYIDMNSMIPMLKQTKNDINIFINDQISNDLHISGKVIKYGIPNIFQPNKKRQMFLASQHEQLTRTIETEINMPIICRNDYNNIAEYHKALQDSMFYFNIEAETAIFQQEVLLAMSAGCIILSVGSPIIDSVITNMVNGIIVNNIEDLKQIINQLSKEEISLMSITANKTILDKFNSDIFSKKWKNLLTTSNNKVYTR